ncbi:hypothetical protein WH96_12890 [Kiloniella spongiae]|uniref:Uncharacterized protein n=1 Tax=Kiloniella spongiae TaxID=1489064 RepID=A0A0H2MC27_9PROT|nr:hypothetical protein [Kiloniella spongiae]KLN60084.1 hypothetical protein WH96_12890 [Kiloniella spongiae]
MVSVAQLGESFSEVFREESLVKTNDGLLSVPVGSGQGVHALQEMLANSVAFENTTQSGSDDLNQSLRSMETASSKMSDLFLDEASDSLAEIDVRPVDGDAYRPTPFLNQGMLSFYMHSDETVQDEGMIPMPELVEDEEFDLVPTVGLTLH